MTKLLGMITGNPYILLGIILGAFAFGATSGGSIAWWIQGLNATSVEQKFTKYQQEQVRLTQEEKDRATTQREKAGKDYEKLSGILTNEINDHAVLKRCIAAGKCGVRNNPVPACTGIRLPAANQTDGTGGTSVSATGESPAESCEELANLAAAVQLKLNQLQLDIMSQPNYPKEIE